MTPACMKQGCKCAAFKRLTIQGPASLLITYACLEHVSDLEGVQADLAASHPQHAGLVVIEAVAEVGQS